MRKIKKIKKLRERLERDIKKVEKKAEGRRREKEAVGIDEVKQ